MNVAHTHALLEINTGVAGEAESWEPGEQEEMSKETECFPWEMAGCSRKTREGQAWRKPLDGHAGPGGS